MKLYYNFGTMEEEEPVIFKTISITIPLEMYDYLRRNPGINRSEIFREKVEEIRIRQVFQFEYQKFILETIVMFTVGLLVFFMLPFQYLFMMPFIFGSIAIVILFSALVVLARFKERMEWLNKGLKNSKRQENQ